MAFLIRKLMNLKFRIGHVRKGLINVSQKFEKSPQLRVGINRLVRKRIKFSSI